MTTELQKIKRLYRTAKSRCQNPQATSYCNYGGRGIQFKFTGFDLFYIELGPRPPGYTLDRINNERHYESGNIRWASHSDQNKNKRIYKTNTSGFKGLSIIKPTGKYKSIRYAVRKTIDGKRITYYKGINYTEAMRIYNEIFGLE